MSLARRAAPLLGLGLLAGAVLLASALGQTEPARPPAATFSWPVPGRVTVTERTEKKGQAAVMRYDIAIARAADGRRIELRYENMRFLEVAGRSVTSTAAQAELAPVLALASAIPTTVVSPEGKYEDMVGLEEMIEALLRHLREDLATPAGQMKATEATLRSPAMVAQLRAKLGDTWGLWVGLWVGLELAPGATLDVETSIPMPDGSTVPGSLTFEHLGKAAAPPGAVRLSARTLLEGEEARKAMERWIRGVAKSTPGAPTPPERIFESFRRETRVSVVTDLATLRPAHARSEMNVTVKETSGKSATSREVHDYTFEWPMR